MCGRHTVGTCSHCELPRRQSPARVARLAAKASADFDRFGVLDCVLMAQLLRSGKLTLKPSATLPPCFEHTLSRSPVGSLVSNLSRVTLSNVSSANGSLSASGGI
jgi:hypothetical protein